MIRSLRLSSPLPALLLLALAATVGIGQVTGSDSSGAGAIVLVSGRDDHGLLQQAHVPLYREQEGTDIATHVSDGTFAEVLEVRGTWLRIRSLLDPSASGWIDDFHLRSRAVLHNNHQVTFVSAESGAPVQVEVRLVQSGGETFWVQGTHLTEVGADVEPHDH